jgi:flagellar operon protein
MNISANNFQSIEQMSDQIRNGYTENISKKNSGKKETELSSVNSFEQILQKQNVKKETELKFSRHATERLASRNIDLTGEQRERLENAVSKASEKGIQESLVMVDDMAFIVNIPNNTVITAVNDTEDAVFTNIDGAVIS